MMFLVVFLKLGSNIERTENRERPNVHFAQLAINIQENDRDKRDMDWCFYLEKSYSKEKYSKVNFAER